MKKTMFIPVFLVFFCMAVPHAPADEIVLGADSWPPFNGDPGSRTPGYMIEVAQKVFKAKGHTLVYKTLPWARAIKEARENAITGIVGASKGDAQDFIFPENDMGRLESHFYVRKDDPWQYTGIDSLKQRRLGLILDYDYGTAAMEFINANRDSGLIDMVGGNDPLKNNILKLKAERVDVVIEVKPVFDHKAAEMGVADLFRSAGSDGELDPVYIAFSPKNPKSREYAGILSHGIERLRQSGELAQILAKYGQKDWL